MLYAGSACLFGLGWRAGVFQLSGFYCTVGFIRVGSKRWNMPHLPFFLGGVFGLWRSKDNINMRSYRKLPGLGP